MKILLGYSYYRSPFDVKARNEAWLARLREQGIQVDGYCLTLNPPGPCLLWRDLDLRWHLGDRELLKLYENLARKLEDYDVFLNYNGINLHPDFVQQLKTFNVYNCADDPESSDMLSRPVAWAYDMATVNNIAAVDSYRSWGVKQVHFWPLGFHADSYDPSLTRERILEGERNVSVSLICERTSSWRRERLDKFQAAFPKGEYYGRGWPKGYLPEESRIALYQQTRIGMNIHNSTGPINFRTYELPANGVMQICDNKLHLGQIFELNKEVAGFDTIEEAIELCRYFQEHDEERREIAAAGWERALKDYNELAVFRLMMKYIEGNRPPEKKQADIPLNISSRRRRTSARRVAYYVSIIPKRILRIPRYLLERTFKQ